MFQKILLTLAFLLSLSSCNEKKSSDDDLTNILLLNAVSASNTGSITYNNSQANNTGYALGFITNATITDVSPVRTGPTPTSYSLGASCSGCPSTLPSGLNFDTTTGTISGRPTGASSLTGSYRVSAFYSGSITPSVTNLNVVVGTTIASITCNTTGIAASCTSTLPFSCPSARSCYRTLNSTTTTSCATSGECSSLGL
jgi:hypothetical protein